MSYLVVGLGNPGVEYARSRHNVGFMLVDAYAAAHGATFVSARYGDVGECRYKGRSVLLLKPNTYMNESGKAVRYWLGEAKVSLEHLLIVVDDLALPVGSFRLRAKGGAGSHNGLKDIEQVLSTGSYARLRIGVGNDFRRGRQVEYVLEALEDNALVDLQSSFPEAMETVDCFIFEGVERAMNKMNRAHVGKAGGEKHAH